MAVRYRPVKHSVFALQSTLLIILCLRSVSAQEFVPVLTITPKVLKLKAANGTSDRVVFVRCSTGVTNVGNLDTVKILRICHKGEDADDVDETVAEATDTQKTAELKGSAMLSSNYQATGTLGTSQVSSEITFTIKEPKCKDAGRYRCMMTYIATRDAREYDGHDNSYITVAPFDFSVTRTPADKPISIGDELLLSCTAVVGTLRNDELTKNSKLVWVYRIRDSAIQNVYNPLELEQQQVMEYGDSEIVECSERQSVNITITVQEVRDSLRDYFCVAARYGEGIQIHYEGGGRNTSVSMPSFEKARVKALGLGGFVGIGLGGLALLTGIVFGIIWIIRRNKKRQERMKEIEARKSQIDERRKSITSIVERRKSLLPAEESSVVESSIAESSVAESSVAGHSVVESSAASDAQA